MNKILVLSLLCAVLSNSLLAAENETVQAPYINSWLVCGPFDNAVNTQDFMPKAGQLLSTGETSKEWEYFDDRLWNRNYDNYQDLSGYYAVKKGIDTRNKYVYAHTYVYSPSAMDVQFCFGTSGSSRLFVNRQTVTEPSTPAEVHRDMFKQPVTLKKGWNSILLEIKHTYTKDTNQNGVYIAKDANTSYLGFYGRFSDAQGAGVPDLTCSVTGQNNTLTIDTQALSADDVVLDPTAKGRGLPGNVLPIGYLEWPYVWNKSLYGSAARHIMASPYQFGASGGRPGYRWKIVSGALPDGLALNPAGTIDGFCEKIGTFNFILQVTDQNSRTARKKLSITVKDRPTRWFEEGRVGALSHCIPVYNFWVDDHYSMDLWAERAKRQGHSLVSIESLQQNYYWPSKFEDSKHPRNLYQPRDKDGKILDGLESAADAVKRYGMQFGLYYATEGGGLRHYSTDVFVQNVSDLILRYDPAYLYFDGPQTMKNANYDVMFSNVRNYSSDIIINSNVWSNHGEYGDADLGTSEASHIYSKAHPARFTKRVIVEPWKSVHTKNNPTPYYAKRDDFRQVAKEMIMNAGRGYVDNNDQMPLMSRGPNWDSPEDIAQRYPKSVQEFVDVREGVAGWFAPAGKSERHESTTGTVPYFLSGCGYEDDGKGNIQQFAGGKGPEWGYATARDNNIYLHFIQGPDGKKGYRGETSVTVHPVNDIVKKVSWLNENKSLSFDQQGKSLTIQLESVTADPIDTIIKIVTDSKQRKYKLTNLVATGEQLTAKTLKVNVEGYMTYPALKVPFGAGDIRFASSNKRVAKIDRNGVVTAVAPGKATITATGTYEATTAQDTLNVIVDTDRAIRVDDTLIGAVLRAGGKETYGEFSSYQPIPFTIEGRSEKGGPIDLRTANITFKCGRVDYNKGTKHQPVYIEEVPVLKFSKDCMTPEPVEELTRVAAWAEVNLDGQKVVTNKVFIDLMLSFNLLGHSTSITASDCIEDYTPDRVNDGITIDRDGSDSSKWSASAKAPSWIAFDLKTIREISEVKIHFNTLEQRYINTPDVMEIQSSENGKDWFTVKTATPPACGSGAYFDFSNTFIFKPVKTRWLRLYFPEGSSKGTSVDLLEIKLGKKTVSNLAVYANATASSNFDENRYHCRMAIDGIKKINAQGEWASKDEVDPWIQLNWDSSVAVNKIVLYDRPLPNASISSGTLTFSDGSTLKVTDIPNDGSPKVVEFAAKRIQWIKFQISGGQGSINNGLSELEVFGPDR